MTDRKARSQKIAALAGQKVGHNWAQLLGTCGAMPAKTVNLFLTDPSPGQKRGPGNPALAA